MADKAARIGLQLGNYRLVRLLGKGGFAEVYLAEHIHLNTQVAVKLLHTQLSDYDIESFKHEAQTVASLLHPHIIRVLDFGVEGNAPYLVMDYAPNGTLRQRHQRGERLPLATIVSYVQQVAEALQYAHDQRLIHRDIKPENMLLGRNQEVLLSDFGIALVAQSSQYQNTQNIAGTIAYMSPEQIQAHPRPTSDQYSLGIVAYEWLCGQRPFQGSFTEIAVKHSIVPPPPLREQLPTLPKAVELVIMTALHKDPHQRFATIHAFAQALEQASQQNEQSHQSVIAFAQPSAYPAPEDLKAPSDTSPNQQTMTPSQEPDHSTQVQTYNPTSALIPPPPPPYQQTTAYYAITPADAPEQNVAPQKAPRRLARRIFVLGSVGLVAGISAATWFGLSHQSAPSPNSNLPPPILPPSMLVPLLVYTGHADYIWSIAWSPDGKYIVSGAHDGTAHVWNPNNGQLSLSYRSNVQPAKSNDWAQKVAWSSDSTKIVVDFLDGTLQTVQVTGDKPLHTYTASPHMGSAFMTVDWSPNGRYFATAGTDNTIYVLDMASGNIIRTCTGHTDTVNAIAWSHDNSRIASCSLDSMVKVWDASNGKMLLNYGEHHDNVYSMSWSSDDTRIASAGGDGTAQVWDSTTGHTQIIYKGLNGGLVYSAAWSNHGSAIASSSNDIATHIWDARTGKLINKYASGPTYSLAWSPDDTRLVTAGFDKTAKVWKA